MRKNDENHQCIGDSEPQNGPKKWENFVELGDSFQLNRARSG